MYANHSRMEDYESSKPHYHDPDKLLEKRRNTRGVRDLFQRTLDRIASVGPRCATLSEIDTAWRRSALNA